MSAALAPHARLREAFTLLEAHSGREAMKWRVSTVFTIVMSFLVFSATSVYPASAWKSDLVGWLLGSIANVNRQTLKNRDLPESILYVDIVSANGGAPARAHTGRGDLVLFNASRGAALNRLGEAMR
jgi:hypothetical protein